MGGTWGSFSPVRWICWHPFGGIGLKAARPNRTAEQVYGQPNRRVGVRVRRSQLMREKSLVPKFPGMTGNSPDVSKGIFRNEICNFES